MGRAKKILKIVRNVFLILLAVIILAVLAIFIVHQCLLAGEKGLLEAQGYINPVSAGDYNLNVYMYGNENPKHTIVGLSGMGVNDYAVSLKGVTDNLSDENKIVIIDRAGYGWSDDTTKEQTIEQVVNDYRTALKNAGCEAPYILMPHSLGGVYATYWLNTYPDEIEAVMYLDPTGLADMDTYPEAYDWGEVGAFEYIEAIGCKVGLQRIYYMFESYKPWGGIDGEQIEYAQAFAYKNTFSFAQYSEYQLYKENIRKAYNSIKTTDIPKLYIEALVYEKEDVIEYYNYTNSILSSFGMENVCDTSNDAVMENITQITKANSELTYKELTKPYIDKLGNCTYVNIPGDHYIFLQKPNEVTAACKEFLATLK